MRRSLVSFVEPLECRIAPAAVVNPLPNIVAGAGKTSAAVDLGNIFDPDPTHNFHTFVTLHTNFDSDPNTPGIQGDITIELYDDLAPLTVQNFLSYATNTKLGAGYIGTFFQRLSGLSGNTPLNVLQGGGYDAANFQHIATPGLVPNELNSASNLMGTVGLAKGPETNSGGSEFYVNLTDNSQLDNTQNAGGFTVFGKLTPASLAVVQALEQQANVVPLTPAGNSAFHTVPTQNNYSFATGGPLPTPSQLFTVTGVDVQPPNLGHGPSTVTYAVSVSNPATSPKLVTFTQTGEMLNLNYLKGGAGVSTVKVTAHDSSGWPDVVESFQVSVLPDLFATSVDTAAPILTDGDTGKTSVKITNLGAGVAKGKVDVFFYLSRVTVATDPVNDDPSGSLLNDIGETGHEDRLIGTLSNVSLNLAGGSSITLSSAFTTPDELKTATELGRPDATDPTQTDAVQYRVIAEVLPHAGTTLPELYTTDNSGAGQVGHRLANLVGSFNDGGVARVNVPIHYVDENGNQVVMTLKSGGFGVLNVDGNGNAALDLVGTTGKSALAAAVTAGPAAQGVLADGGHTALTHLFVDQPLNTHPDAAFIAMGTIAFGSVDLSDNFSALGGLKSLTLGNLTPLAGDTGTHELDFGNYSEAVGQKVNISLGSVTNYNLVANEAIGSLKAKEWLVTNSGSETVVSRFLDSLVVQGDFEANLAVRGAQIVKTITIGGVLRDSEVHMGGNVGNVTIGAMVSSDFLVGVESVPTSRASFDSIRTIASFILKGSTGATSALSNSNIVAAGILNIAIPSVDGNASGTGSFGVVAEDIVHYERTTTTGPHKLSNLVGAQAMPPDSQGRYAVALI